METEIEAEIEVETEMKVETERQDRFQHESAARSYWPDPVCRDH